MMPHVDAIRRAVKVHVAALPVPYRTSEAEPTFESLTEKDAHCEHCIPDGRSFPVALDPTMGLANAYGVRALPASFLIDRDGYLAALALGPRAWDNRAAHALVEGMLTP